MNPARQWRYWRVVRSSLWIVPVLCVIGALMAAPLVRWADEQTQWMLLGFGLEGARAVMSALASSLLTFLVFALSILLLAVQISCSVLTPRFVSHVFEHRLAKFAIGAFVFAWVYTITVLGRIEDRVPQLSVFCAVILSTASVAFFIYFVQSALQSLRPVMVLAAVESETREAMEALYPLPFDPGHDAVAEAIEAVSPATTIHHAGRPGYLVDYDARSLLELAVGANCTIEMVPRVGDYVAPGADVFRLGGDGAAAVDAVRLRSCLAIHSERRVERDPAFGIRTIVDIACRALSPAVNDPTTGTLAIDRLEYLLRFIGQRRLDGGVVKDAEGHVRVVYRALVWEDFVTLAMAEIRAYGAGTPQVTRRMFAMFRHLSDTLPASRFDAVRMEMSLLREAVGSLYGSGRERLMPIVADTQGFGGREHLHVNDG